MLLWRDIRHSSDAMENTLVLPSHIVILVVENNRLVRELLQDVLSDEGYQVIVATNSEEALTAIATIIPNLLTLELELPGISGEVMLKELRQRDDTRDLPVVIVSAKHPISKELRTLAQATITKPFDLDKFLAIIRKLIPLPPQEQTTTKP